MNAGVVTIAGRSVGAGHPCFVISEIGTNHNGDLDRAKELVKASAAAGADAVKFQIYEAEDIVTHRILPHEYGLEELYPDRTMYQVFDECLRTPQEWFPELCDYSREVGILPMATVHSASGARFVVDVAMVAIKIASMDLNNLPVLSEIAKVADVPLIVSTGMSELHEIDETVAMLRGFGKPFGLLHCVSNYPPRFDELHLQNIDILSATYGVPVGFSDHTLTTVTSAVAVALGACMIEKHITMSRTDTGPDHPFALEPGEFRQLVDEVRNVEKAHSPRAGFVGPSEREAQKRLLYRRSLVTRRAVAKGAALAAEDIKISRPGSGIEPKCLGAVIGRTARRNIDAETPLTWDMV